MLNSLRPYVIRCLSIAGLAYGAVAAGQEGAVLHFADLNGIRDWRPAQNGEAMLIEGRNGKWYRATFLNRCSEINFTETLGFVTDATGDLTSFSSIVAGDRRCFFDTLERTSAPDPQEPDADAPDER